jgi:hypothetical protein
MMEAGRAKAFGSRDDVLSRVLKTANGTTRGASPLRVIANVNADGSPMNSGTEATGEASDVEA